MRRLLVAALVLCSVVAAANEPAHAQQGAAITLNPTSDTGGTTGTWSITVTGTNWAPGRAITSIQFSGTTVTPSPPPVPDASGRFTAQITVTRRPAGSYTVTTTQSWCAQTACFTNTANATFTSVVGITLAPACHRPNESQSLTVNGTGWPPNSGPIVVSYDNGADTRQVNPNADSTMSATFNPVTPPDRDVPIVAQQPRTQATARAIWSPCPPGPTTTTTSTTTTQPGITTTTRPTVPGSTTTTVASTTTTIVIPPPTPGATLVVDPPLGPGGFVARARGTGFPANQPVNIGWSPGIGLFVATAGADGTFESQVLIMSGDVLGPRTLVATSGPVAASAPFLVVPSTMQPSGQDVAQINRTRRFLQR